MIWSLAEHTLHSNLREEATLKMVRRAEAQLGIKMTLKTVHGKEGHRKYGKMPTIGTPSTGDPYWEDKFPQHLALKTRA